MNNDRGKSAFGLDTNVAAGLAYVPVLFCHLIVSIAVLTTDKTNKLPRFHAIQSLLHSALMVVATIIFVIASFVVMAIVAVSQMPELVILIFLVYIAFLLFALIWVVGLVISCIKGFQGQIFKLPIIGNFADKWSN
ncbi:MAG: hypothetical protein KA746_12270 [Pyrinomonadaceae bacterium]|nr:hypothetical protein [Pyrinomonadaceae bacterium]